jgi:hypothetical protein
VLVVGEEKLGVGEREFRVTLGIALARQPVEIEFQGSANDLGSRAVTSLDEIVEGLDVLGR